MGEIATLFTSGILVILTGVLAWYTRTLAAEARAARLLQVQPQVIVTIEPSRFTMYMDLVIVNVGQGVARNVVIAADPDIELERDRRKKTFNEYTFLKLDSLKPGQEIRHFIGSFGHFKEHPTTITSICQDELGKRHTFTSQVDVSVLEGLSSLGEDPYERAAKNIEKIAKSLERVTDFKRIRVDCYSSEDRAQERRENEEWAERVKEENAKRAAEKVDKKKDSS